MNILITGGNGFLGKHVKRMLDATGHRVLAPTSHELDLRKRDSVDAAFASGPDVVLHMAAVCGGILANKNSPADFLHVNMDMASNLFHAAKAFNVKTVYTLGSVCAYPKFCQTPFKEDDIWNGYPEETNAPYGMAKRLLMMLSQTYRQQYGFRGAHLIPVNMYGEGDHFDLINSHVIPALIRKFVTAVETGQDVVECWGSGEATREFLYAGDAAEAITTAVLTGFDHPEPINLGTGKDISIKNLAHLISKLTGFRGEIYFNGTVSDGQPKRVLDVSRAKKLLNWTANTKFEDGLARTINWYKQNRPTT